MVWMFHCRRLNSRVDKLHEMALKIVYRDYASSFTELLEKDNSTTMHNRNIQLLATELFKVKNGLSSPFMNEIFVENAQHYYDLRKKTEFKRNHVKTVYNGTKTLTFWRPRIWEIVPGYIKKVTALRNLNWKQNYGIQKTVHAGYAKGSYHKLVFYNIPFNFYAAYFIIFKSHFILSILNRFCLLL